jgi:hypothetical protein
MQILIKEVLLIIFIILVIGTLFSSSQAQQQLPIIAMINLNESQDVDCTIGIIGEITGSIPDGKHMWVFVCRNDTPEEGRPQEGEINPYNGTWYQQAIIDPAGIYGGVKFDINVILVGAGENSRFSQSLERNIELPGNAIRCLKKTVRRRTE